MYRVNSSLQLFVLAAIVYVSLGCIITPRRAPMAVPPGVSSIGVSYGRGFNLETNLPGHLSLLTADFRRSAGNNLDWGFAWTYDFTDHSDGQLSTIWGDVRYQLLNRSGESYKPMLCLGYGLGQSYNSPSRTIVSIPVTTGMKFRTMTGHLGCRVEYITKTFNVIPEKGIAPRTLWTIGCEIPFKPNKHGHGRRFDVELGFVNSLFGGPGDNGIIFNFVVNYDLKD